MSQFLKLREDGWDGSALEVKVGAGYAVAINVITGAEAAECYLHFYDVAASGAVSGTPFWSEPLPPSYYSPFRYGPWQDFQNGLFVAITDSPDGTGSAPANPVTILGRVK